MTLELNEIQEIIKHMDIAMESITVQFNKIYKNTTSLNTSLDFTQISDDFTQISDKTLF